MVPLPRDVLDKLNYLRGPGESYSDVILRGEGREGRSNDDPLMANKSPARERKERSREYLDAGELSDAVASMG